MTVLTLYGKPRCHLCDAARAGAAEGRRRREFEVTEVDITLDPGLFSRYGERIPVLDIDGEEVFELGFDAEELDRRLGTVDS